MAIIIARYSIPLDAGSEITVTREDRNDRAILGYSERKSKDAPVRKRLEISLSEHQSAELSRALDGVFPADEDDFSEEDTIPGKKASK